MPGAQFWEVRSLPAVFAAVNVEQKRLKQHGFPTLYRREGQHVLCIDPMCQARHGGWMWDGRWGESGERCLEETLRGWDTELALGQPFWDSGWGLRLSQGSDKKKSISSEW